MSQTGLAGKILLLAIVAEHAVWKAWTDICAADFTPELSIKTTFATRILLMWMPLSTAGR
jgi:hypothetical protein